MNEKEFEVPEELAVVSVSYLLEVIDELSEKVIDLTEDRRILENAANKLAGEIERQRVENLALNIQVEALKMVNDLKEFHIDNDKILTEIENKIAEMTKEYKNEELFMLQQANQ